MGDDERYLHTTREIFTDGSPHSSLDFEFWMGDSRGRWDANALVVDVTRFTDQTWFDRAGNFHSDKLKVVERYTPQGPDHMWYEATIEDPNVFAQPWTITRTFTLRPDLRRIDEFICENNRDYRPLFGK